MSVRPSVRPSVRLSFRIELEGFSLNLILEKFFENQSRKFKYQKYLTRIQGTLHFSIVFRWILLRISGPGSSVGIATSYGLDGPGIESRWGGARFSAPIQTGPGAHPASCTMGTGSSPGVESARGVTLTPHPLLVPRSKNRVELYLYSP
jgi:hypothetical protein